MSFVPAIKTTTGKKQIDYNSMANRPNTLSTITVGETHITESTYDTIIKHITATKDSDTLRIKAGNSIEFEINGKEVTIHDSMSKNIDDVSNRIADDIFDSFILSDETREKYGLTSRATVDNVLQKIKNENPVGTLKNSMATSLGSDWLRCNGGTFSTSAYPELAKLYSGRLPNITTGYGYVYIKAK